MMGKRFHLTKAGLAASLSIPAKKKEWLGFQEKQYSQGLSDP